MRSKKETQTNNKESTLKKNKLEWSIFGLSVIIVLLLIGYLIYKSFTHEETTPNISVNSLKDPSPGNPFRYRLIIINSGGQTAEEVKVEAALLKNGESLEKADLQISLSPKLSEKVGWVNFTNDPSQADSVTVKVVSYKKP